METKTYPLNTSEAFFSDDLIHEILLRLPVKSLLRFKSVCKSWNSLQKDPVFALKNIQFNRNFSSSHLIVRLDDIMFTLHLDLHNLYDHESITEMKGKFLRISPKFLSETLFNNNEFSIHKHFRVIGSCNGLICIRFWYHKYIYLWNPTTNDYKEILVPYSSVYWGSWLCLCGFGYVSSTNDYKIVLVTECQVQSKYCRFAHVYSLRQNRWKELENCEQSLKLSKMNIGCRYYSSRQDRIKEAVLLNDSMYWYMDLINVRTGQDDKDRFILKFDMVEETFERVDDLKQIDRRDQGIGRYVYGTEIGVSRDDTLCVCRGKYSNKYCREESEKKSYNVELWMMDKCINPWKMKFWIQGKPGNIGMTRLDKGLLKMIIGDANVLIYEIDCPNYMAMENLLIVLLRKIKGKARCSYIDVKNEYCAPYKSSVEVVRVVNYVCSLISPNSI